MRTLAIALLTCAFALAADSPFVGTWTMNKAKSKPAPGGQTIESLTTQIVQDGPSLKSTSTVNGTTGSPFILDGKEHDVTRSPTPTRTVGRMGSTHYISTVNGKSIQTVFKKHGKTVGTRKSSLSADGKMMTSVTEGTGADGQRFQSTIVFDKQ
jgi:hypothetical protein